MDITLNLNTNMMSSTGTKSSTNKNSKADNSFDSIMNIGNNTDKKTFMDKKIDDKSDNYVDDENQIESPRKTRIESTKSEEVKDTEEVSSSDEESSIDKVKENEEEIRNKKRKEECAASEVLSMIMNTLTNENVNLDDYIVVNEDMTISFNDEKIQDFISQMQGVYESEVGLNFNEVLENVTDILMGNNKEIETLETNIINTDKSDSTELINMALNFIEDKINELLPEQIESNEIQIETNDLLEELQVNLLEQNADMIQTEDTAIITDDEVLDGVKNIINELLGNVNNKNDELEIRKNNFKSKSEKAEDIQINVDNNTENIESVNELDTTLQNESNESEDSKSDIKDGKRENKDVKRVNINNNEVDYTLNNKNFEIKENFQKVTVQTVRENLASNFAENLNVVKQTISGISLSMSETSSEMNIKLDPENLGKINLKVATENGIVMAKFEAESQRVKEILEANLSLLKESLSEKGISVQSLEVSVSSNTSQDSSNYDYERNANKSNNPHKIPRNGINKIVSIVDNNNRSKIRNTHYMIGNNVNYIA